MKRQSFIASFFFACTMVATSAFGQGASVFFTNAMNFGLVDSGVSAMKPIVVNMRFDTLHTVHGTISLPTNSAFSLIGPDTFTVGPRATDTVAYIRFTPNAAISYSDSIFITHDGNTKFTKNPTRILVSGQGLPANDTSSRILLSRTQVSWSTFVDTSVIRTLVIRDDTSTGTVRTLRGVIHGVDAPFALVGSDTNFTIAPGGFDTIQFSFISSDTGRFLDTLTITSNADAAHDTLTVFLLANVGPKPISLPKLFVSSLKINYGKRLLSTDTTVDLLLRETGGFKLLVDSVMHKPAAPFALAGNLDSIRAFGADTLAISFNPKDTASFLDSLVFVTNESSAPGTRHSVLLQGQGYAVPPPPPKAVELPNAPSSVVIYPNPAKSSIVVHLTTAWSGSTHAELVSLSGKSVYRAELSAKDGTLQIPAENIPSGDYFLSIQSNFRKYQSRVSIVK